MIDASHTRSSPDRSDLRRDDALLPCPFCGAVPEFEFKEWQGVHSIWCRNEDCNIGCETSAITFEEAKECWNKRLPLPGAVAQGLPNPVLVKALNDLHVWCEVEGCGDQAEIIKDAFIAAGITEYRCANCDGAGEWDEGPLRATSSAQISPDYRHMVCSDCEGKGTVALTSTDCWTEEELAEAKVEAGKLHAYFHPECQCEHPMIKCDAHGCRCTGCGKMERHPALSATQRDGAAK